MNYVRPTSKPNYFDVPASLAELAQETQILAIPSGRSTFFASFLSCEKEMKKSLLPDRKWNNEYLLEKIEK